VGVLSDDSSNVLQLIVDAYGVRMLAQEALVRLLDEAYSSALFKKRSTRGMLWSTAENRHINFLQEGNYIKKPCLDLWVGEY
jgi:hypothetical protein